MKWLFIPATPQAWESSVLQEWRRLLWQCLQQPVWSALVARAACLENWRTGRSKETLGPGWARALFSPPRSHGAATQLQWAGQLREICCASPISIQKNEQTNKQTATTNSPRYQEEWEGRSYMMQIRAESSSFFLQGLCRLWCAHGGSAGPWNLFQVPFLWRASEPLHERNKKACHLVLSFSICCSFPWLFNGYF